MKRKEKKSFLETGLLRRFLCNLKVEDIYFFRQGSFVHLRPSKDSVASPFSTRSEFKRVEKTKDGQKTFDKNRLQELFTFATVTYSLINSARPRLPVNRQLSFVTMENELMSRLLFHCGGIKVE